MIYRGALAIDNSSAAVPLVRASAALFIGGGGSLSVDMANPNPIIQSAQIVVTTIDMITGAITGVDINYGGIGYTSTPNIKISAPYGGSSASITATLTSGYVSALDIADGGSGYNVLTNDNKLILPILSVYGGNTLSGSGTTFTVPAGILLPISVSNIYKAPMSGAATEIVVLYESLGSTVLGF